MSAVPQAMPSQPLLSATPPQTRGPVQRRVDAASVTAAKLLDQIGHMACLEEQVQGGKVTIKHCITYV